MFWLNLDRRFSKFCFNVEDMISKIWCWCTGKKASCITGIKLPACFLVYTFSDKARNYIHYFPFWVLNEFY